MKTLKTADEILEEAMKKFHLKSNFYYSRPAILEAIHKFADQQKENKLELAEELWDSYSEYIDDNLSSLETVAGTSVIKREDFIKAIEELLK